MNAQEYSKLNISETEAQEIEDVYDGLLDMIKKLQGKKDKKALNRAIVKIINFIIETLESHGGSLLLYTSKIFDEDYIIAHSLDVCIISVRIGQKMKLDKDRIKDLGLLALTHARKDMGLPEDLMEEINPSRGMSEIMRLADVYDALTHPPAYRHAMLPCDTFDSIINSDKFFDRRLVKVLLEELSLYPLGSWVQLSTREIGRVIEVKKGLLLRPKVKIVLDWESRSLEEEKIIDLAQSNLIHVKRPLTKEEVLKKMEREESLF